MRTFVLPLFLLGLGAALAQDRKSPSEKPTVVFVCEHGSAKSIIAASEFERMAKEKGLDLNILARGTNPDAEIPKLVRDGLKADGYDVGNLKPTKVTQKDLKGAARIVSFGPDLKPWLADGAAVSDWSATPPSAKTIVQRESTSASSLRFCCRISKINSAFQPDDVARERFLPIKGNSKVEGRTFADFAFHLNRAPVFFNDPFRYR